jgi:hypothetical protein
VNVVPLFDQLIARSLDDVTLPGFRQSAEQHVTMLFDKTSLARS